MLEINEIRISRFTNISETKLPEQCMLSDVLDSIKHPSQELKSRVDLIRKETDKKRRDDLKVKLLPVLCFSGTFSEREDAGIIELNPIICLDLDKVSDMDAEREKLKLYPCVYAIFASPTNLGLKVLLYHDVSNPSYHKELYYHLGLDLGLIGRSDLEYDLHCSNVSRGCFLSYDKKLWVNNNAVPYHFQHSEKPVPLEMLKTTAEISFPTTTISDYCQMRKQIQETHTLFEQYYSMYPGCRNKNLYILARFFRLDGIPEDIATCYLIAYYKDDLNGFPATEIRKTVESAYK